MNKYSIGDIALYRSSRMMMIFRKYTHGANINMCVFVHFCLCNEIFLYSGSVCLNRIDGKRELNLPRFVFFFFFVCSLLLEPQNQFDGKSTNID